MMSGIFILDVVLAKGSKPVSICLNKYSEKFADPGICWDQKRLQNNKRLETVQYHEVQKVR